MSAPIKAQLIQAVEGIKQLIALPVAEASFDNDRHEKLYLNQAARDISEQILDIQSALEEITKALSSWSDLLRKESTQREAQDTACQEFQQSLKLELWVAEAHAMLAKLKKLRSEYLVKAECIVLTAFRSPVGESEGQSAQVETAPVQLPTLRLSSFAGDPSQWTEFFENFTAGIGASKIPPIQKFTYLRSLLSGEAKSVINGLALSGANYAIALELLTSRYGNQEATKRRLYHQLQTLKTCHNLQECKQFQLQLEQICRQLEQQGEDLQSSHLVFQLEQKLPKLILRELLQEKSLANEWNTSLFRSALIRILEKEEACNKIYEINHIDSDKRKNFPFRKEHHKSFNQTEDKQNTISFSAQSLNKKPHQRSYNRAQSCSEHGSKNKPSTGSKPTAPCRLCEGSHWTSRCATYQTSERRLERAAALGLCCKCLQSGHATTYCSRTLKQCHLCKSSNLHHPVFCPGTSENPSTQHNHANSVDDVPEKDATLQSVSNESDTTLFMCVSAVVSNPEKPHLSTLATVFFDSGSNRSYITDGLANKLRLTPANTETFKICTFGTDGAIERKCSKVQLRIATQDKAFRLLDLRTIAVIVPKPTAVALSCQIEIDQRAPMSIIEKTPEILIGIDQMHTFLIVEKSKLPNGFTVSDSALGPIISGKGTVEGSRRDTSTIAASVYNDDADDLSLEQLIKRQQEAEFECFKDLCHQSEDQQVLQNFSKTTKIVDKRFEVSLPWIEPRLSLPTNYHLSCARLTQTMKKLQRKPQLLAMYDQIMKDQLATGVIERVEDQEQHDGQVSYIPHQAVIREDKVHTKLRVVYDGSAKGRYDKYSLNQCLHRGPLLLNDLTGVLLRFRQPANVIIADIEKAFLQISINPEDRDACRFLWPSDPFSQDWRDEIATFRFTRVTFGLKCSPFLLAAAIQFHLQKKEGSIAKEILDNIYVDNIIMSAESPSEIVPRCQEAKALFQEASMNLREFASNNREAIARLKEDDRLNTETVKVLGIKWNTKTDKLYMSFDSKHLREDKLTKRIVTASIASVFDPHGWMSPALLPAKLFQQKLWLLKKEWDESLSDTLKREWMEVTETWKTTISFPRQIIHKKQGATYQLHVFSDASKEAYGAAAYLVSGSKTSKQSSLIFSRSLVKPVAAKTTIPRLELQAVVLSTRIAQFIKEQSRLVFQSVQLWTDSQCVIHWLKRGERQERFVENRLKFIREYPVRYVNTKDNPADVASRGVSTKELQNCHLWWSGPSWLCEDESNWKTSIMQYDPNEPRESSESAPFYEVSLLSRNESYQRMVDPERVSSWIKLKKITAFVFRFVIQIRAQKPLQGFLLDQSVRKGAIQAAELILAERFLFQEAQKSSYPDETTAKALNIVQDKEGTLRCTTRIGKSDLTLKQHFPIFLPQNDRTTKLIVMDIHSRNHHPGANTTCALVRQRFWIPKGRKTVASIIFAMCRACKAFKVAPYSVPQMPDLPRERVTPSRPFENTGLDYFGPVTVKQENGTTKVWACIFTCFVSRAIHLEVALDYSAEQFLNTFRRFIGRRGVPKTILSDNGTNFRSASKVVTEQWQEMWKSSQVQNFAASEHIKWQFITERAPWRGAFWERLIGIIKNSLRRVIGRKLLNLEDFTTLIIEIEAVVNNRPLTFQSDAEVLRQIRPIDLLIPSFDRVSTELPPSPDNARDPDYIPMTSSRDRITQHFVTSLQRLDQFWKIWQEEYLNSLLERHRFLFPTGEQIFPSVGDVVIVKEDDHPRSQWKMARILELVKGSDGKIRTALLKCNPRNIKRAINLLYPLELSNQSNQIDTSDKTEAKSFSMSNLSFSYRMNDDNEIWIDDCGSDEDQQIPRHLEDDYRIPKKKKPVVATIEKTASRTVEKRSCKAFMPQKQKPVKVSKTHTVSRPYTKNGKGKNIACKVFKPHGYRITSKRSSLGDTLKVSTGATANVTRKIRVKSSETPKNVNQKDVVFMPIKSDTSKSRENEPSTIIITNTTDYGFEPTKGCNRHQECEGVTVLTIAESIPVAIPNQMVNWASKKVPTLLHVILIHWACREANRLKDKDTQKSLWNYVTTIVSSAAYRLLSDHEGFHYRTALPKVAKQYRNSDVTAAINLWTKGCQTAQATMETDLWKPVRLEGYPPACRERKTEEKFVAMYDTISRSLTTLRQKLCRPLALPVWAKTLFIVDSRWENCGRFMFGAFVQVWATECLKTYLKTRVYLTQQTRSVVLVIGYGLLLEKDNKTEEFKRAVDDADEFFSSYTDVKSYIVRPPTIQSRLSRSKTMQEACDAANHLIPVTAWEKECTQSSDVLSSYDWKIMVKTLARHDVEVTLAEDKGGVMPFSQPNGRQSLEDRLKVLMKVHL